MSNNSRQFKKGHTPHNKGKGSLSGTCLNCDSVFIYHKWERKSGKYCSSLCYHEYNIGEIHKRWAKNPAYTTVHNWVHRTFGFPNKCEECGIVSENNRKIHWSNVSGLYIRERSDWQRLCVSCHKKFDLNKLKQV